MGSWFSNLHVRKTEALSKEMICNCVTNLLIEQGYTSAENMQESDVAVAVVAPQNNQWVTICSEIFVHDDPDSCKAVAMPLSSRLHTDVLGIACFDSDYLYLNLINADENADAWVGIGIGKELGITRRNNLTAWKKKVVNHPAFSEASKNKYICADEFLSEAECFLCLPAEQGGLSLDYLQDTLLQQNATLLYFKRKQVVHSAGPQLQICHMCYAVPCFDGRENSVSFINVGDAFCGLYVYFLGPYVQHGEITFSDVRIERYQPKPIVVDLNRIQLSDGQWAYCYHDSEILIPPGVPKRMKPEKRYQLEKKRMLRLSFVPHGNPRKMLDITVVVVPQGNPENQAKWNIWQQYGSKQEFIKYHNKIWKRVRAVEEDPNQCLPFLKQEDFEE